ncbi:MAG: hypothetical protein ABSH10_07840 [Phycisphaerae bacterium]|jgi:hypothetical protein
MRYKLPTLLLTLAMGLATSAAATPSKTDPLAEKIQAIKAATNPSEAIQAYAVAININDKDPQVYDTYIKRMLDFGMVDALDKPAEVLVKLDPNNGTGWAVVGFGQARQGKMPEAFDDAVRALNNDPNDLFALHVAGQFVAWYEHQTNPSSLPASITQDVIVLRNHSGQPAYMAGYQEATTAFEASSAASQPANQPTGMAAPQEPQYYSPQAGQPYEYYYYAPQNYYNYPSDVSPYPYGYYNYPAYSYYPYTYYLPFGLFFFHHGDRERHEHPPLFFGHGGEGGFDHGPHLYFEEHHQYGQQPGLHGPTFFEEHNRLGHSGSPTGPVIYEEHYRMEHMGSPTGPVISEEHRRVGPTSPQPPAGAAHPEISRPPAPPPHAEDSGHVGGSDGYRDGGGERDGGEHR